MRGGKLVDVNDLSASDPYWSQSPGIQIMRDIAPYQSPVSGKWISSRPERRDDLRATGCREVDPTEKPAFMRDKR